MEKIFVKVAKNDEFEVVGYAVFINDVCMFRRGCTTNPDFYYVKNITVNVETYTKIITLNAGIEMMEKAENDFFSAFKHETIELLNKTADKKGTDVNTFNLGIYRDPRKKMESELEEIIKNLK